MKKSIKTWLWVMVIGFVIITMILGTMTGCIGKKVVKSEETQATTTETSVTTTEDTTQKAILDALGNINNSLKELKISLATEETTETTEVAATTEETTTEATDEAIGVAEATGAFSMGWEKDWRMSTVPKTKSLPDEKTQEFFNEPGVYPGYDGKQTAWDKIGEKTTSIKVSHNGGTFISWGGGNLTLDQGNEKSIPIVNLPFEKGLNYLVFIRGLLQSDETEIDFNRTVIASDYVAGHAINHLMPEGAYFSLNWTLDQVSNSFDELDCSKVIVVAIDLQTRSIRSWEITDPDGDWERVNDLS